VDSESYINDMKERKPLTEYMTLDEFADDLVAEMLDDLPDSEDIKLMNDLMDVLDENDVPRKTSIFLKLGQDCYDSNPNPEANRENLIRLTYLHFKDD
jgi:hypothetical protein